MKVKISMMMGDAKVEEQGLKVWIEGIMRRDGVVYWDTLCGDDMNEGKRLPQCRRITGRCPKSVHVCSPTV